MFDWIAHPLSHPPHPPPHTHTHASLAEHMLFWGKRERESSVQFSPLTDWVVGGTWSSSLYCRRPLWAVLAWADMSTLWCSPSSICSADHGVAHPPRCQEGWFGRGCRGVWHAWTMQVSVSSQLPEEVPVHLHGSWSRSSLRRWSCAPNRKYEEISSCTWFQKPGSFLSESASRAHVSQP